MYKPNVNNSSNSKETFSNVGGTFKNNNENPPTPRCTYIVYFKTKNSYDCVMNDCYLCRFNGCMRYGDETRVVATEESLAWLQSKNRVKILYIKENNK